MIKQSGRLRKIFQYFPDRAHSLIPCDRAGNVKRIIRGHDRIYLPEDYEHMIVSSRKLKPLTVSIIKYTDIVDFKSWWPKYYM